MIVGTAGHVDHGKTTLVRALTGVDTDRLKEEKARGISIELGYAYVPGRHGDVLGFIDVPGHERLVHTMVAGACGIDAALLVVAADDGVKPQTREHLAILELLGITAGAVALTKIDRVDSERREEVREQIGALLAGTSLCGAPVFSVDASEATDPGVLGLRGYLEDLAARLPQRRTDQLFRLAVDRVFTLPGHGTIVAGTIFTGAVRERDMVTVMPGGARARVRSLHAQNRAAQRGQAGERCALNLVGIEKRSVARGDWLAEAGLLQPTVRLDVRLRILPGLECRVKPWAPLHVHLGTSHRVARVALLETPQLSSGEAARVQLVFDSPVCAQLGDRFIVRNPQSTQTVGGGRVLDPQPPGRRSRTPQRLRYLEALEQLLERGDLAALLRECPQGLPVAELVRLTGLPPEQLRLPADTLRFSASHGSFVILSERWDALRRRVLTELVSFHARFPEEVGPDVGRLRRMALPELSPAQWEVLVADLVQRHQVARVAACLRLPSHAAQLSASDRALMDKLAPLTAAGRFDPPWVRELAATAREPEERVRAVLRKQVSLGEVYQIVPDLFYHAECVAQLAAMAAALTQREGTLNVSRFRDAIGVGRKRAVQILEFFDRVGYTRRVGSAHVLRRDSGWDVPWKVHAPGGAPGLQTPEGAPSASW
jgi:selenocysteine-specific elongation factor